MPTAVYKQRQTQPQQPPIPPGKGRTKYSGEIPRQNTRTSRTQRKLITPIKKASFRLLMAATILRAYRHGFQPQSILPTHIIHTYLQLKLIPAALTNPVIDRCRLFAIGKKTAQHSNRAKQKKSAATVAGRIILSRCLRFGNNLAIPISASRTIHLLSPLV